MYAATTICTVARRSRIPRAASSLIARRGYHENIVDHYENPRNVGALDKNDENVGTVSDLLQWRRSLRFDGYACRYDAFYASLPP